MIAFLTRGRAARAPAACLPTFAPLLRLLALALVLGGVARASGVPPDIQRIAARGALVVAVPSFDAPPFFYTQDGEVRGLDADMAHDLANALGVQVRFNRQAATFNDAVDLVAEGRADIAICKLSRTLARARKIRFSDPYLTLNHALAIHRLAFAALARGRDLATVVRNFTGSIGVIDQSAFADYAVHNFPQAHVVRYPDWNAAVRALLQGQVTALYRDEFEIERLFRSDPRMALTLRTVTFSDIQDSLGMAVASDSHQLLAVANLYLAQRTEKLTVAKVLERLDEVKP